MQKKMLIALSLFNLCLLLNGSVFAGELSDTKSETCDNADRLFIDSQVMLALAIYTKSKSEEDKRVLAKDREAQVSLYKKAKEQGLDWDLKKFDRRYNVDAVGLSGGASYCKGFGVKKILD